MEAKGRKMFALGIVAMMCAVAIIGVGYAAFTGNASTYNQGNTAATKYLQLDNTAWTAMVDVNAVNFDEYTYQTGHAYYKTDAVAIENTSYKGVLLTTSTKDLTLTNKTGAVVAGISFSAFTGSAIGTTDFVYVLKVSVGTAAEFSAGTEQKANIVFNNTAAPAAANIDLTTDIVIDGSVLIKMSLYLAYQPDVEVPSTKIGPATAYNPESPTPGATPAKASETGPAGANINSIGFGFSVTGYDPA